MKLSDVGDVLGPEKFRILYILGSAMILGLILFRPMPEPSPVDGSEQVEQIGSVEFATWVGSEAFVVATPSAMMGGDVNTCFIRRISDGECFRAFTMVSPAVGDTVECFGVHYRSGRTSVVNFAIFIK